jgi:hypothetical protein
MRRFWSGALTEVLCRATDDDPSRRHATVVEFWSDLAQVAEIAEDESTTATTEDETIVRPRLKIAPGEMPKQPLQPDFEVALASPGSHASFSTAEPIAQGPAGNAGANGPERIDLDREGRRPSKFFVDLQKPQPAPPIQVQERPGPAATVGGAKPAARSEIGPANKKEAKPAVRSVTDKFNENLRRRIFIAMIALAFLGSLVSIYNFAKGGFASGSMPPKEIEVVTLAVNVRTGPSDSDAPLGIVARGSRHKVLTMTAKHPVSGNSWMQIEVSKWEEYMAPGTQQNIGWVYGDPNLVRVVSRRWW